MDARLLDVLENAGVVQEQGRVVLWYGPTRTAAAYRLPTFGTWTFSVDAQADALAAAPDDHDPHRKIEEMASRRGDAESAARAALAYAKSVEGAQTG